MTDVQRRLARFAREVDMATTERPPRRACATNGCPRGSTTSVRLRIGGRDRQVAVCDEHGASWTAAEPYAG